MGSIPSKLLLLGIALGGAITIGSCTDRLLVDPTPDPAVLALQPSLLPETVEGDGVSTALARTDNVWLEVRAGEAIVFEDILPFDPEAEQLGVQVEIPQSMLSELLTVTLELRYGDVVLFRGQATTEVEAGLATQIEVGIEDVPATLTLLPPERSLTFIGDTLALSAVAVFATGDTIASPQLEWEALDESVDVDGDGHAIATDDGEGRIEVRYRALADTTLVEVEREVAGVLITTWPEDGLSPGDSAALGADAIDAGGHPMDGYEVAWESSEPDVAAVEPTGVLHALDPGEVTIYAQLEPWTDSVLVAISERTVDHIEIDPASIELVGLGSTVQLTATARAQDGVEMPDIEFTWSSDETGIVSVNADGLARAQGEGTTTVRVEAEGVTGTAPATVEIPTNPYGRIDAVNAIDVEEGAVVSATDSLRLDLRLAAGEREIRTFYVDWEDPDGQRSPIGLAQGALSPGNATELSYLTAAAPGGSYRITLRVELDDGAMHDLHSAEVAVDQSDQVPPVIEWIETTEATTAADSVAVRFLATDDRGISRHRIYLNGELQVTTYLGSSAPEYETQRVVGPLEPGENTIQVTVSDVALLEQSGAITVVYDDGSLFEAEPTISVGNRHVCRLEDDGRVHCWGVNHSGRLGHGGTIGSSAPVEVAGGHRFVRVSASETHACGIDDAGAAWCWGANDRGQLGDGSTTGRQAPTAVSGSIAFREIAVGLLYTCGLDDGGNIRCWGRNERGQLGVGDSEDRLSPTNVASEDSFSAIGVGLIHACGITTEGTTSCWGVNSWGQLGDGTTQDRLTPVEVDGGVPFEAISPGGVHSCALDAEGAAYCWGGGFDLPLGDGTTQPRTTPTAVVGGLTFAGISAHRSNNIHGHTCARTAAGDVYCWGYDQYGQLGVEDPGETCANGLPCALVPTLADTPTSAERISTGMGTTCMLGQNGNSYCWGQNAAGQLGRGTVSVTGTAAQTVGPVAVPSVASVTIDPAELDFTAVDDTLVIVAHATDTHGYDLPGTSLQVGNAEIAQIGQGYVGAGPVPVFSRSGGSTWVDAVIEGQSARTDITVAQEVTSVVVTPAELTLAAGAGEQLTAEAFDANGHPIPETGFEWQSSDDNIATVDAEGLVTGVGPGEAVITASSDGVDGVAEVLVFLP